MEEVLSKMRKGIPFRRAVDEVDTDARTVLRLAGSTLRKGRGGYVVQARDRLLRVLYLPDEDRPGGLQEVTTRDSRQATRASNYWHGVHRYLTTGDAIGLAPFRGKTITDAQGKRIRLLTDLAALDRLASAGVLSFESIYARMR